MFTFYSDIDYLRVADKKGVHTAGVGSRDQWKYTFTSTSPSGMDGTAAVHTRGLCPNLKIKALWEK